MSTHTALRDSFRARYPHVRYGLGDWREYNAGIWEPLSESHIRNNIQTICDDLKANTTNSLVSSVLALLKDRVSVPNKLFDANPYLLVFEDQALDLVSYRPIPHNPEHYATRKLNFKYDPHAKSPAWDTFLSSAPYIDFLQEFAGYCLTPETLYEVAIWLHGPAGGGKSTFITGMQAMLGPKCCTLGLWEIERSSFALGMLPGRTLAISTEQPNHYMKTPHLINAIISGEPLLINRKYQDHIEIVPHAKLLWAMNDLPRVDPNGGAGIFRRVYPVYWDTRAAANRDPRLKEEIAQSGAAVVNWALEGLKRLKARGGFDFPEALTIAKESYRDQSDITFNFVDECCERGDSLDISASILYESYSKWCKVNGHRPLANNRFTADLVRLGFTKVKRNFGNLWLGLELCSDFQDFTIDPALVEDPQIM